MPHAKFGKERNERPAMLLKKLDFRFRLGQVRG